ncbi:hypothetical protein SDRG_03789 [Saprolegnia diclina VS20]|uniref:Uncharacterized protein n=1 Tax=Saprolegnia diclina (strain VS20) TaxID=1156394 RepID=T0QVX5_SAPDV|nr:hypothetical protein SDRG_03789 [Saprolegnia diclina VS20]EQC38831.1 hypothetical protein SDRG_03789 [Saprolegnia diclina VS20]|eukprot:XP_008607655.1 hypothetical protein SDRG_03789 [Saprolegnia diclina VS20]
MLSSAAIMAVAGVALVAAIAAAVVAVKSTRPQSLDMATASVKNVPTTIEDEPPVAEC